MPRISDASNVGLQSSRSMQGNYGTSQILVFLDIHPRFLALKLGHLIRHMVSCPVLT